MNEAPKTKGRTHRPPAKHSRRAALAVLSSVAALAVAATIIIKSCGCAALPDAAISLPAPAAAASSAPAPQADLMAGHWSGSWASDSKPLKGKLTAVIARLEDGAYRAVFDAESPLGTNHSVCVFRISARGAEWKFEGKEDLGWLKGGTYVYRGAVDGRHFTCTYDSTFDKGVFRMERENK
jgi:hypothetical protein